MVTAAAALDDLPSIIVHLFVHDADIIAAQRALNALRRGDTRAMLAAAITDATRFANGYRVEFIDEPEAPTAADVSLAPASVRRRLGLLGGRP